VTEELISRESNIPGDLPKQNGRNVAALVKRHSRAAAIGMAILAVRTALSHLEKTESLKNRSYFARSQGRKSGWRHAKATI
jgi:hypothetical protein